MKKIAFLHRIWPVYGGGETVTKCLANELVRRGHDIYVIYTKQSVQQDSSLDNRIHQILLPNIPFDENSSEFFIKSQLIDSVTTLIKDIVIQNGIEIIINQWWPVEFIDKVRKETGVKVIKCLHMDPDTHKVFNFSGIKEKIWTIIHPFYRILEREKHLYSLDKYLTHSDLLIFLAPSFLHFYRNERKSKKDVIRKTDFVFNPLVYQVEGPIQWNLKEKKVLFVGRLLEKHKQVSRILRAWKYIEANVELKDWELQIVGDGPSRALYEHIIEEFGLSHVSLEGYQNPLPYYQKASLFVMTSAYEGWGMTLVEAQQNGVVPVAMDTYSSLHDIITNGENGIIVLDNDIDAFTTALSSLMFNADRRRQMAEAGLKRCKQYQISHIVNKWEEIFNRL